MSQKNEENRPEGLQALYRLMNAVRTTFHVMTGVGESIYSGFGLTPPKRNILFELAKEGPKTVPRMAAERPVSRQRIQILVDSLAEAGLVESVPNPAHARSCLIRITPAGRRVLTRILALEARTLGRIDFKASPELVGNAADLLLTFRKALQETVSPERMEDG